MTAWAVSELPCGCYMRQGDGRWFYQPDCPHHAHLYPKGLSDSPRESGPQVVSVDSDTLTIRRPHR